MKVFERFLDVFTKMLNQFFDFGEKRCILAYEDVQRSYERIENEERFLKTLMYLVIEIFSGLKTLLVVVFYLLTDALLTGLYWLLVRIYGLIKR